MGETSKSGKSHIGPCDKTAMRKSARRVV